VPGTPAAARKGLRRAFPVIPVAAASGRHNGTIGAGDVIGLHERIETCHRE